MGFEKTILQILKDTANMNNATEAIANLIAQLTPLTDIPFEGQFNLASNYEVYYNQYSSNTALTPTVTTNNILGAAARVVIDAGSSASLVDTNIGTKRIGSDDFTASKLNEIIIYNIQEGLTYTIKLLN